MYFEFVSRVSCKIFIRWTVNIQFATNFFGYRKYILRSKWVPHFEFSHRALRISGPALVSFLPRSQWQARFSTVHPSLSAAQIRSSCLPPNIHTVQSTFQEIDFESEINTKQGQDVFQHQSFITRRTRRQQQTGDESQLLHHISQRIPLNVHISKL